MKNYILKTLNSDMTSNGYFRWKKRGIVECGGLHGALNGVGDGFLFNWNSDAIWLVAEVDKSKGVNLYGEWKFPSCKVVFTGNQKEATDWLLKKVGDVPMIGCFKIGGNNSTVSGGEGSTVSGGHESNVSGGKLSTVRGGDFSIVNGGNFSTVRGGYGSTVSGGEGSILQVKYYDGKRYRIAVRYVGEKGIKANVFYKVDSKGKFIEVN